MIARNAFRSWDVDRQTVSRSLRLLAVLLLVVILRTVQTEGDHTFIAVLSLIGMATLVGAIFLRRRRNRQTPPPVPVHIADTIQTRPATDSGTATPVRGRNASRAASPRSPAALTLTSKCLTQQC